MSISKKSNITLISVVLWAAIGFSTLAFVYHVRWFIPFLQGKFAAVVPPDHIPFIWFLVQICSNIIFLIVGFLLVKLFRKYRKTGFFDEDSLKVFDVVIISCLILALFGAIQSIANNFAEVHFKDWTSLEALANLVFRSFTKLIVFKDPQTFYILLAVVLWTVRQFVTKALEIKTENEAFI